MMSEESRSADVPRSAPTSQGFGAAPSAPRPSRAHTAGTWLGVIVAVIIAAAFVVFVLQNTDRTVISFLGWHQSLPLSVALLAAAVAGILLAAIIAFIRRHHRRHRTKSSRR